LIHRSLVTPFPSKRWFAIHIPVRPGAPYETNFHSMDDDLMKPDVDDVSNEEETEDTDDKVGEEEEEDAF
ncbi:MAG: hypothetical protein WBK28_02375, partial [Minisyncoccia bacterium]